MKSKSAISSVPTATESVPKIGDYLVDNTRWIENEALDGLNDDELVGPEAEKSESVEEYLDREDLNRMEWDRLNDDLHPHQTPDDETRPPRTHRDTDAVQQWMRSERQKGE